MIEIQILRCKNCNAPLPDFSFDKSKEAHVYCTRCRTTNIITKAEENTTPPVSPLAIPRENVQEFISVYSEQLKQSDGKDTNALYTMGLLYLNIGNYELAQRNFQQAIDISPYDADMYYYFSLALLGGKTLKNLDLQLVQRIEMYLGSAIKMEGKSKYYMLWLTIKKEYYEQNGIAFDGPGDDELAEKAAAASREDADEIRSNCRLRNASYIADLKELYGEQTEKAERTVPDAGYDSSGGKCSACGNELSERGLMICPACGCFRAKDDPGLRYISPSQRDDFVKWHDKPERPRLKVKPSYPVLQRLWKLLLSAAASIVLLIIIGGFMGKGYETVRFKADAEGRLTEPDKAADYQRLKDYWFYEEQFDADRGILTVAGIPDSGVSLLWWAVILLPLLIWIVRTAITVARISSERGAAARDNDSCMSFYRGNLEAHEAVRKAEYRRYMPAFLGDMAGGLCPGRPGIVEAIFEKEHISEEDLVGKVLLCTWLSDSREISEKFSTVYFSVAALSEDHLNLFHGQWNAPQGDNFSVRSKRMIFYRDITAVDSSRPDMLRITAGHEIVSVELPGGRGCLCRYNDPARSYSSSDSRTTDTEEFAAALNKLVLSYKNR